VDNALKEPSPAEKISKIRCPPRMGAIVVPKALNACHIQPAGS